MTMGDLIKSKREELGMKQIDLADMIGVKQGSIWNWESGTSKPKIELILPLANALKVDPNYLFGVFIKEQHPEMPDDPGERVKALHERFGNKKTPSELPPRESAFAQLEKLSERDLLLVQKIIDSIIEVREDYPEE